MFVLQNVYNEITKKEYNAFTRRPKLTLKAF